MESPTAHRLPPRDLQPLHVLSPERVNAPRPSRSRRMAATDPEATENPSIPPASSSGKNNVFADFSFGGRTPTKEASVAGLPQSPSLPEFTSLRTHVRTNSDVQGLVKRFEHLDVRDREAESAERKKKHEAELRRAQIAREEAESDVKRLREELRRMKKEGDEGHERERRVGKRLEVVMEEYATSRETYASQAAVYEKEVRKARKEAFKSSSAVLKLQEELKSTRNYLRAAQSNLDMEKRKVQQKEQETFSAQYQFVALQEEFEKLQTHVKVIEEEREALKTNLKEEEVARIAAEGRIALPSNSQDDDDLLSSPTKRSPRKRAASPLSDDKENVGVVTKKVVEARRLAEELNLERMRREHAEELADFLRLECQYSCCSCRSFQSTGRGLTRTLSADFTAAIESIRESMLTVLTPPVCLNNEPLAPSEATATYVAADTARSGISQRAPSIEVDMLRASAHDLQEDLDQSITMAHEVPDHHIAAADPMLISEEAPRAPHSTPAITTPPPEGNFTAGAVKIPLQHSNPKTAAQPLPTTPFRPQPSVRTVTTTTTIPMHFTPSRPTSQDVKQGNSHHPAAEQSSDVNASFPPTFDREAALAAIAYRRGRAKSIADGHATPRKQMMEGVGLNQRRDISAPALGQKPGVGASVAKGPASTGRTAGSRMV